MSTVSFPLSPVEKLAKTHAILCATGFLVLLPIGALIARYGRNITKHWFYVHTIFQLVFAGPVIFVGWSKGNQTRQLLQLRHFHDTHQTIGVAVMILYIAQLVIGLFIHFVKMPSLFAGHRPPQNYVHVLLGIAILALAAYEVHLGLYTEWLLLGGLHQMSSSATRAWLALVVIFWGLYFLGLAFVPRQLKQEKETRQRERKENFGSSASSA